MAGVKSSSHVPKFGDWDTDDVPYTICFENARELQAAGLTFDPNDPDTYPPPTASPAANHKSVSLHAAAHDGGDHQRRPNRERRAAIGNSGSEKLSSERSGSDYSLLKEARQSRRKKSSNYDGVEGISRFPPGGHGGNANSRVRREGEVMKASVPKFGSWDARETKSGDGYTEIFNKVKIEKQIAANLNPKDVPPLMMNQTTKHPVAHATNTHGSISFFSKICCCLCPK